MASIGRPDKRIELILSSLIGERVDVILETVDCRTAFLSIAVAPRPAVYEGKKGVCVSLRQPEMVKLHAALGEMLGREPA